MTIRLEDYETGAPPPKGHKKRLKALQKRLFHLQVAHIVHRRRAIIMFEGWDASGKGGTIRRLTRKWDPRYFEVYPIAAPTDAEKARHFLWRFWQRLPAWRNLSVFDRSWYGRVLVERVEGYATPAEWQRAYDEINAFEAEQIAANTPVIKLFMHIDQDEQDRRLASRLDNPWKRWKTGPDDYRNRAQRPAYLEAISEMLERTDTATAPWKVLDANDKRSARLEALSYIADCLEANCPASPPPLDPSVAALAETAFGYSSDEG